MMVQDMKDNLVKEKKMALVNYIVLIPPHMRENSKIIKCMDKVYIAGQMVESIMDNGLMVK